MSFIPIAPGTPNWADPVNAALQAQDQALTTHVNGVDPHGDRAWASSNFVPLALVNLDTYLAQTPFYCAHRGSGGEFPEHTLTAYTAAAGGGAQAIEVSCQISADGVLFCMHDTTLTRITGGTFTTDPTTWTWAALNNAVQINQRALLGQGWALQPITTLKEVMDRFFGKVIILLEGKSSASIVPLQNLLMRYPNPQNSVIWKNYYTNNSFPWAKAHGFKTWGYTDPTTTMSQMDAVEANVDLWGVPWEATDAQFQAVLARPGGKKVMTWEVHRRSEVTRLLNLGVSGIMASQWLYLGRTTASQTADQWFTQVKAPGEIGAAHSDATFALKFDTGSSAYAPATSGNSVLLGSFCPAAPGASGYKIQFDMMWPVLPAGTLHAGLYFGAADDAKHTFGVANATACYRMLLRPNSGAMQLYTVASGATSGVQVGSDVTTSGALTAGSWYSYEIEVNATQVVLRRTDSTGWSGTFANTAFRGGYLGIHNGSLTDTATLPRYRNFKIVAF
jgi:glycerophosphoryl diester phosphodiesterase